jgi:hypothetical protein
MNCLKEEILELSGIKNAQVIEEGAGIKKIAAMTLIALSLISGGNLSGKELPSYSSNQITVSKKTIEEPKQQVKIPEIENVDKTIKQMREIKSTMRVEEVSLNEIISGSKKILYMLNEFKEAKVSTDQKKMLEEIIEKFNSLVSVSEDLVKNQRVYNPIMVKSRIETCGTRFIDVNIKMMQWFKNNSFVLLKDKY